MVYDFDMKLINKYNYMTSLKPDEAKKVASIENLKIPGSVYFIDMKLKSFAGKK